MSIIRQPTCGRCGQPVRRPPDDDHAPPPAVCGQCAPLYPGSLLKAVDDSYAYALQLRTGSVICFERCVIHGEWVWLSTESTANWTELPGKDWWTVMGRGIDVRLSDIVWCADAPS